MRGKALGVIAFNATESGASISSCTFISSGETKITVPTRKELEKSKGELNIFLLLDLPMEQP